MDARLAMIRRHPIKSIGGEGLGAVDLRPARRLPGDREWAVLTEAGERLALASQTDGAPDRWLPKSAFLRGVAAPGLQAIEGGWRDGLLELTHPSAGRIAIDPETEGPRLIDWLRPLWSGPAPTRLVRGAGIWTDQKWPWVSILSLDSLADLEARTGRSLGHLRWRGNLWTRGLPPFAERDWPGRVIRIGAVELRVTEQIGRCEATSADPATGRPDIDMLDALRQTYGHTDFGVFAEVVTGGTIRLQDQVTA